MRNPGSLHKDSPLEEWEAAAQQLRAVSGEVKTAEQLRAETLISDLVIAQIFAEEDAETARELEEASGVGGVAFSRLDFACMFKVVIQHPISMHDGEHHLERAQLVELVPNYLGTFVRPTEKGKALAQARTRARLAKRAVEHALEACRQHGIPTS